MLAVIVSVINLEGRSRTLLVWKAWPSPACYCTVNMAMIIRGRGALNLLWVANSVFWYWNWLKKFFHVQKRDPFHVLMPINWPPFPRFYVQSLRTPFSRILGALKKIKQKSNKKIIRKVSALGRVHSDHQIMTDSVAWLWRSWSTDRDSVGILLHCLACLHWPYKQ